MMAEAWFKVYLFIVKILQFTIEIRVEIMKHQLFIRNGYKTQKMQEINSRRTKI